jgi:hypothetical protein
LCVISAGSLLAAALLGNNVPWGMGVAAAVASVVVAFQHVTRGTDPSVEAWLVVFLACAAIAGIHAGLWWKHAIPAIAGVSCGVAAIVLAAVALGAPPETRQVDPHPDAAFRIVALGDSYISGEGAARYFPGTDVRPNRCHRAATAYPYLVADKLQASLTFVACSGARTYHVLGPAGQYQHSDHGVIGAQPQLTELQAATQIGAVLLSIGGNDAGFTEIGVACITPLSPECQQSAPFWMSRLEHLVLPALINTFNHTREAARGAPVFAMTYPNPIGPHACPDIEMTPGELSFLRERFIPRLNHDIKLAANLAQIRVIDLENAFAGRRICERRLAEAAVNFIALGRTRGTTLDLSFEALGGLIHGTFHPNEMGHEMLAHVVAPRIAAARDGRLPPLPPSAPTAKEPSPTRPSESGPTVGPQPFPALTQCRGREISVTTPTRVSSSERFATLRDLRPASTVCFHAYRAQWRSTQAGPGGTATVPIATSRPGLASVNEIIAQAPTGAWKKVVPSRLGETGPKPSLTVFYILAGILTAVTIAAVALRLHKLRQDADRA